MKAEYTKFDCRISGRDAQEVLARFKADIDARKKVLIGFRIGDIYPETYTFDKGGKIGQTGVVLKGRLTPSPPPTWKPQGFQVGVFLNLLSNRTKPETYSKICPVRPWRLRSKPCLLPIGPSQRACASWDRNVKSSRPRRWPGGMLRAGYKVRPE